MAKAKDKTTKRKRTLTAKAAAAAPTGAPARAGKKPKKQSAKPAGAAQPPVETQETAALDHIVWDPPETTDTGSQDVDTLPHLPQGGGGRRRISFPHPPTPFLKFNKGG